MKIGIVIPLKSKSVSKNWDVTSSNLLRTVKSIEMQACPDFRSVVVGHDIPDFFDKGNFCTDFISGTQKEEIKTTLHIENKSFIYIPT